MGPLVIARESWFYLSSTGVRESRRQLDCRTFMELKPLFPYVMEYLTEEQLAALPTGSAEQIENARRSKTVHSQDIAEKARVFGHAICGTEPKADR